METVMLVDAVWLRGVAVWVKKEKFCKSLHSGDRSARRGVVNIESAGLGRSRDVDVEREVSIDVGKCTKDTEEGALLEVDGVEGNMVKETTGDVQWGERVIEAKPAVL